MASRLGIALASLFAFLFLNVAARAATCPCTIWPSSTVPAMIDQGADSPVELGLTFRADTNGFITGIRFYKSAANTGTHIGNLWSSTGTLLASATFTNETASGWQQVNFASPVAITANTNYVASYHMNSGHYSIGVNYFATAGVDNSPLHAPANGSGALNGPYAYGSTSAFPSSTYQSTNYWVDVVFTNAVAPPVIAPPAISSQPAGQTIVAGQTATFSVTAAGGAPLSYQWRKNGGNITGATAASYTTPVATTADNGAQFSVVVSNSAGSVTSSSATLTVNPAVAPPVITSQPAGQTVIAGQTATFTVAATGSAPLTFQWTKNGAIVSGANSSTYTTPVTATADNAAQFSVVVSNSAGSVTSNAATLTVNPAVAPPAITSQPAGQTIVAGQTATFSVVAAGSAPLSYQWRKNGGNIAGATSASYTTPVTTTADNAAQFSVVVSNSAGSVTSSSATLTVNPAGMCPCSLFSSSALPAVIDQGPDSSVELGVTFKADSNGYITGIRFYKSSANTGTHSGNLWSSSGALLATATFTSESASGWQQVNFANPVAITANTMYVASYHASNGHYSRDGSYFATSGVDNGPLHAPLNGNGGLNGPFAYGSTSAFPNSTYQSTNYWVDVVFNTSVNTTPAPPTITSQPAGQTVIAGQTATFNVAASGTGPLTYQWRKNGVSVSAANSSTYTTPATTTADNGAQFSVVVSNSAGSATSNNATLTVNAATRLLSANPASLSFGNVTVNLTKALSSTLTNTGNSSVTVSSVGISGPGISVSGVSVGQVILPGQTATLNVTFAPVSVAIVTGSATITSNASNSPTTVSLTGTGVQLVTHSSNLSWVPSASTGVVGYNVYSGNTSGGPYAKITTSPVAVTTYQDSGVQSGRTYYYVVTAVNSSSKESTYSNQAAAAIP